MTTKPSPQSHSFRAPTSLAFTCIAVGLFALLIWAKLRVVTGIPRTAYADPENRRPQAQKAPAAHDSSARTQDQAPASTPR